MTTVTNILHQNLPNSEKDKTLPFRNLSSNTTTSNKKLFRLRTSTDADQTTPPMQPQPPLQDRKKHHFIAISVGGTLLTMNAGFVNAVTALHSGMYTSHVSGTFTRAGISIEQSDGTLFAQFFMLIMSFMFGSFLCSLLVPYQTFYLGRAYNLVFMLGTVSLLFSALLGIFLPESHLFAYFAAISCGMQNAMTTGYSGSVLRTTHMTGMTTDVGIILGKLVKGERKDLWKLAMFVPMMLGFLIGGTMGAKAVTDLGVYALFMNVVLFAGTGLLYVFYLSTKHHIPFLTALLHNSDLLPRKKGVFVPKDDNIDVAEVRGVDIEDGGGFKEGVVDYGDGFDNDEEIEEADLTSHEKGEDQNDIDVIEEEEDNQNMNGNGHIVDQELDYEDENGVELGPSKGEYLNV